jgi:chromosome segregation ATPase
MKDIPRKVVLLLLGWLEGSLDSDLGKRVDDALDKARRLSAINAAAKKDLAKLETEFDQLKLKRDELHCEIALIEQEIESVNDKSLAAL